MGARNVSHSSRRPYCGVGAVLFLNSGRFYGSRDFGPVWACEPCKAWVGTHKNSHGHRPLGRLANKELRVAKILAHHTLDALWHRKMVRDHVRKKEARTAAYKWLAEQMQIERRDCHIGMFDIAQCDRVIEICAPYVRKAA